MSNSKNYKYVIQLFASCTVLIILLTTCSFSWYENIVLVGEYNLVHNAAALMPAMGIYNPVLVNFLIGALTEVRKAGLIDFVQGIK